jgi:hypothetical protein
MSACQNSKKVKKSCLKETKRRILKMLKTGRPEEGCQYFSMGIATRPW